MHREGKIHRISFPLNTSKESQEGNMIVILYIHTVKGYFEAIFTESCNTISDLEPLCYIKSTFGPRKLFCRKCETCRVFFKSVIKSFFCCF